MVYCLSCNLYFKKLAKRDLCKICSLELVGTPPGPNNFIYQHQKVIQEKIKENKHTRKFMVQASLIDITSITIIDNPHLVIELSKILPEGHPPWYNLLKLWYKNKKLKSRKIKDEKYPMQRLFKLLKISDNHIIQSPIL